MKPLLLLLIACLSLSTQGQDLKQLDVNVLGPVVKTQPIYIEPVDEDKISAVQHLTKGLMNNGFTVVTNRADAFYVVQFSYTTYRVTGCKWTAKTMNGSVIEAKNNANPVVKFTVKQGNWTTHCPEDLMNDLARRLNMASR